MLIDLVRDVLASRRIRKYLIVSIVVSILLIPVFDSFVIQRDRNRNMAYGEIFWQKGFGVYDLSDTDLNRTYHVPSDHLLLGGLNVTYEYPVLTLLFYAGLAAIEPGAFQPSHMIANLVLLLIVHLNLVLFLSIGRDFWYRRWFQEIFLLYYGYQVSMTIVFAKIEPLADMFLLLSIIYLQKNQGVLAGVMLGLAVQTKVYPIIALPFLIGTVPIAIVGFLGTTLIAIVPYLFDSQTYTSLINHFFSSSNYSSMITNPYYVGLGFHNPLGFIAPLVIVLAFFYAILETRTWHRIPIPLPYLRTRDWRAMLAYLAPLSLILFSWTMIWYLMWFVLLFFFLRSEQDMERYRWILAAMWLAYFVGILCNLDYFISGPFQVLLQNIK